MSKQIKRQVLIEGKPVEGLFQCLSKNEIVVRLRHARFTIEQQMNGTWTASSLNDHTAVYRGATAEKAYRKFVKIHLCTNPRTGRAVWA